MIAVILAAQIAGVVPQALAAPSRVTWIDSDVSSLATCGFTTPRAWSCEGDFNPARGLVVIVGEDGVAYLRLSAGVGAGATVARWGRLVVVTPGSAAPEDLHALRVAAWRLARSRVRPQSARLIATKDTSTEIVPLSDTAFWVAAAASDPEAFVTLDGDAVASIRLSIAQLAEGPPETPVYVSAEMPFSLDGRVETSRGEDVDAADIELFQLLPGVVDDSSVDLASRSLVRTAATRSDENGRFSFPRPSAGPFLISVLDRTRGRGTAIVRSLGQQVDIRLVPPILAVGRVLRNRMPVAGARVRFVPDAAALAASTDATALVAEDRTTAADGRFVFQLPPVTVGSLQIVGPDGTSVRLPLSRANTTNQIDVGDVSLPDHQRLALRVTNADGCVLWATGPLEGVGLTIVHATNVAPTLFALEIPELGTWALAAECGDRGYNVEPPIVDITQSPAPRTIDARVLR